MAVEGLRTGGVVVQSRQTFPLKGMLGAKATYQIHARIYDQHLPIATQFQTKGVRPANRKD